MASARNFEDCYCMDSHACHRADGSQPAWQCQAWWRGDVTLGACDDVGCAFTFAAEGEGGDVGRLRSH